MRLDSTATLGGAFVWRTRREGLRYLLAAFVPFVAVLALLGTLPGLTHGKAVNNAAADAAFGLRYGARADAVTVGLLLVLTPGLVSLFSTVAVTRSIRGLVGAEVSRGGLEALLGAPYTPGVIAAALLGYALLITVVVWAAMSALGVAAIAIVVLAGGGHLSLDGSYLALALALPLLSVCAGAALAMLVSLLLPRLTQLGAAVNVAGGDLGTAVGLLPAIGALFALVFGVTSLGPGRLLLIAGGATALIAAASVAGVARGFRPETVLDS